MNLIRYIIFLIIVYYLIVKTPQSISDIIYSWNSGTIKLIYYNKNKNKFISYNFNHKFYDGALMNYYIKNNLVKYKIENNLKIYDYKKYQYLNNEKIENYSKFTSSIAHFLSEIMKNQKRKLKICILISTRHNLKNKVKKGNFLKYVSYTINPKYTKNYICKIHEKSINKKKNNKSQINNTTIYELIKEFMNSDYIFNNWRDLSMIRVPNEGVLVRQSTKKITKNDIYKLKYNYSRTFIFLDYLNNHYIISNISKLII